MFYGCGLARKHKGEGDSSKHRIDGFKDGRRTEVGNAGRAWASGDGVGRGRPSNAGRARASGCDVGGEGDSPDQATRASGVGGEGDGVGGEGDSLGRSQD